MLVLTDVNPIVRDETGTCFLGVGGDFIQLPIVLLLFIINDVGSLLQLLFLLLFSWSSKLDLVIRSVSPFGRSTVVVVIVSTRPLECTTFRDAIFIATARFLLLPLVLRLEDVV